MANSQDMKWDRSSIVILVVGFALAFDYSIILVSIQSYWHLLAPDKESLYGFVFGCYDLGQLVFAPIFGVLSSKIGFKPIFVLAMLMNLVGNTMYAMAYVASDSLEPPVGVWQLVLFGRLLAGCGSAGIGLGLVYLSRVSTIEQRALVAGKYRNSQTMARIIAPNIGLPLVGLGFTITTTTERLFNFYTIPGWISAFISLQGLLLVIFLFEDKSNNVGEERVDNEDAKVPMLTGVASELTPLSTHATSPFSFKSAPNLMYHAVFLNVTHFCVLFSAMAIYSQLFLLATSHYHFVDNAFNLWLLYMGFAAASYPTIVAWKRLLRRGVEDYQFFQYGIFAIGLSFIILCIKGSKWFYFIGTGVLLSGLICYSAMMESFYTKKCTQYQAEAGDHLNLFTILQPASSALARFLGPSLAGAFLSVQQSDLGVLYPFIAEADFFEKAYGSGAEDYLASIYNALFPASKGFCILSFPSYFFNEGCDAKHITGFFIAMAVVCWSVLAGYRFYYLPKHSSSSPS